MLDLKQIELYKSILNIIFKFTLQNTTLKMKRMGASMRANFSLKPRDLMYACKNESWSHKARIVGFSILMASVANYGQYYFNMLVYRSG